MPGPNENAAPAILASEPSARLDAIIRRHGGTPKPHESIGDKIVLKSPAKGHRRGQLSFDDADAAERAFGEPIVSGDDA